MQLAVLICWGWKPATSEESWEEELNRRFKHAKFSKPGQQQCCLNWLSRSLSPAVECKSLGRVSKQNIRCLVSFTYLSCRLTSAAVQNNWGKERVLLLNSTASNLTSHVRSRLSPKASPSLHLQNTGLFIPKFCGHIIYNYRLTQHTFHD